MIDLPHSRLCVPGWLLAAAALLILSPSGPAQEPEDEPSLGPAESLPALPPPPLLEEDADTSHSVEISAEVEEAVARGLAWLAQAQNEDGSWTSTVGFKLNYGYNPTKHDARHVGITSLALMAFLAGGNLPGEGRYADVVARGTEFILSCVRHDGLITYDGSRMYSHAFATLFLAEIYGMCGDSAMDARVRDALDRAVKLIVECQNSQGAWRYVPYAIDSDMSIAVCQLQALRAARNVGIHVPKATIDRAIDYIDRSKMQAGRGDEVVFIYQTDRQTRHSFALTAAGVTALHSAGVYTDREAERALRYLVRARDREDYLDVGSYFFWYGHYYAVQAMYQRGGHFWSEWWRYISRVLVKNQYDNGTWPERHAIGPAFSTAVACIILQVPQRYLPILQR